MIKLKITPTKGNKGFVLKNIFIDKNKIVANKNSVISNCHFDTTRN